MKRRIAAITSSRADFSHLYWPLRELAARPEIDLKIVAMGPHLSPEFGHTAAEIEKAGFAIDARIECLLSSDSDVGMAKTIGVATLGLADCLGQMRPDLLLLIADRYEMLAPASVALALRIPIAHIEGGEISQGAIDDAVRNALTKLSHVHFTSTEQARARVIAMGEEEWRVHRAGAPSLDHLRRSALLPPVAGQPAVVVAYHPTTIARDTIREADALFTALKSVEGQLVFCYPNADAGSRALIARAGVSRSPRQRPGIRQSRSRGLLEPAARRQILARQLQQRHHGSRVIRDSRGKRGNPAARPRAWPQCARRRRHRQFHPGLRSQGCRPYIPRVARRHGEPIRRWPRV